MNASPERLQKLNSITVQLSQKEAIQNSKRQHCSALFDQIQYLNQQLEKLRNEVQITQEQLLEIDDEIDLLNRQRDALLNDDTEQSQYPDNLTQMQFGVVDLGIQDPDPQEEEEEYQDGPEEYEPPPEEQEDVDGHFEMPLGQLTQTENSNRDKKSSLHSYFSSNQNRTASNATANRQGSIFPSRIQQQFAQKPRTNATTAYQGYQGSVLHIPIDSMNFPWSNHLQRKLRDTFHIDAFRGDQLKIINCTMSNRNVFCIMRTGGGKSLTYQLPALLEGKSPQRKITLVISPLLALMNDQEIQMNNFCKNSATSFSSTLSREEVTRRWNLLRDKDSGLCLVFVTPEKVTQSKQLMRELQKLHEKKRLARFVVDEAHCCSSWGHDFRKDYTKIGILKRNFPSVPVLAVTATASDVVRNDCVKILGMDRQYEFFRNSLDRPNLTYYVKKKSDKAAKVIQEIAEYIQEHHKKEAGIIYCYSKKEADTIAAELSRSFKIKARAYHADISDSAKSSVHKSWMNNKTQVVVATIAFGLGINKPDVRFVIHHTISKSLEAYYQESGRCGRDGGESKCVLFYSPKDVCRTIGMIHGSNGERAFWSIAKYAQTHGNDQACKQLMLSALGEVGVSGTISEELHDETTENIDVGLYVKDMLRMIQESKKDLTINQIVSNWRSKGKDTPEYIQNNLPNDFLTKEECEIAIISLMIAGVLQPIVKSTKYANHVYIILRPGDVRGPKIITTDAPNIRIRFPKRDRSQPSPAASTSTSSSSSSAKKPSPTSKAGWISTKKSSVDIFSKPKSKAVKAKPTKAKAAKMSASEKKSSRKSTSSTGSSSSKKSSSSSKPKRSPDVIEMLDDSSDSDDDISESGIIISSARRSAAARSATRTRAVLDQLDSSDSECEF